MTSFIVFAAQNSEVLCMHVAAGEKRYSELYHMVSMVSTPLDHSRSKLEMFRTNRSNHVAIFTTLKYVSYDSALCGAPIVFYCFISVYSFLLLQLFHVS